MLRVFVTAVILVATVSASTPTLAQELPSIPSPIPVTVERGTTALLVLDIVNPICTFAPVCGEVLPAARDLLTRARAADMFVVHSTVSSFPNSVPLPEVTPLPEESLVAGPHDKFFNTNLDELLRARGIKNVIIVGVASNGAAMYTAYGALVRGYTVVVAEDGIAAARPFDTILAKYQLLNLPGLDNPQNEPLRDQRVTLSRSDLITIE